MASDVSIVNFFLTSALLMFWLLPATAWVMLHGRSDHHVRLWFLGTFTYAMAASLYIFSAGARGSWMATAVIGWSMLSALVLEEVLRRERGLPPATTSWLWLPPTLWTALQSGLLNWLGPDNALRIALHLLLMAAVDLRIFYHANCLRRQMRSTSLWMIVSLFLAFSIVNVLRVTEIYSKGAFFGLLSFTWFSSMALMLNYLSAAFYCFGYWGYVLEKETHARQQAAEAMLRAQENEITQTVRADAMEKVQSERESMYEQLLNMSRLAQSSALAATVSHELNQPLAVVRLNLETAIAGLQRNSRRDEVMPFLEGANVSAQNASTIITRMRNVFVNTPPKFETRNLDVIVRDCLSLARHNLLQSSVQVRTNLNAPLPVLVSPGEIEHLVLNLLSNALEATSTMADAWIEIKTDQDAEATRLQIRDSANGLQGVSDEQLFELFRSSKKSGMGLGLWLAQHIAQRNHGTLILNRTDLEATCFELRLPQPMTNS